MFVCKCKCLFLILQIKQCVLCYTMNMMKIKNENSKSI